MPAVYPTDPATFRAQHAYVMDEGTLSGERMDRWQTDDSRALDDPRHACRERQVGVVPWSIA